jgi:hypothetical protein
MGGVGGGNVRPPLAGWERGDGELCPARRGRGRFEIWKGLWGDARVRSLACPGLCGEGWQAHSVRRESCDSPSSPEPSAACSKRGRVGRGAAGRRFHFVACGERAGRRTSCAERAVILTAVQSLRLLVRRGACGEIGGGTPLPLWGLWGEAGRRTPCARESCNSDSSPEPAAGLFGGGCAGLEGADLLSVQGTGMSPLLWCGWVSGFRAMT